MVPKLRVLLGGLSPISVTAILSIVVLLGVSVNQIRGAFTPVVVDAADPQTTTSQVAASAEYQQEMLLLGLATSTNPEAKANGDPISLIGPVIAGQILGGYAALLESGDYNDEDLAAIGKKIAPYVKAAVTYDAYEITDFKTDADASTRRVQMYRDDLEAALVPLKDIPSAEFEIYGLYVETNDPLYLEQLKSAAEKYREAATAGSNVVVPREAVVYHRTLLNSLQQFASMLDALATHTDDPFASIALLRTYSDAESNVYASFNGMRGYYAKKSL